MSRDSYSYVLTTECIITPYVRVFDTWEETEAHLKFCNITDGWYKDHNQLATCPREMCQRVVDNKLTHTLKRVPK